MRGRIPLLLALVIFALTLGVAGCGGGGDGDAPDVGGALPDGASLAPASSQLFFTADTDFDGDQWTALEALSERWPALDGVADNPDIAEAREALGPESSVVTPDLEANAGDDDPGVAFTRSPDEAKLKQLLERENEEVVLEEIDGWHVFANTRAGLDRFKEARNAGTLDEDPEFEDAFDGLDADSLLRFYADGVAVADTVREQLDSTQDVPGLGRLGWLSGAAKVHEDGLSLDLRVKGDEVELPSYEPALLDEVPGGAFVFVSFKGIDELLEDLRKNEAVERRLGPSEQVLGEDLDALIELFDGEGALYVREGTPAPEVTLVLTVDDEAAAVAAVDRLVEKSSPALQGPVEEVDVSGVPAKKVTLENGVLYYAAFDGKLVATSATAGIADLHSGGSSMAEDPVFRQAREQAELPDQTSGFLFLDLDDAVPLADNLSEQTDAVELPPDARENLDPLRSLLLFTTVEDTELLVRGFLAVD